MSFSGDLYPTAGATSVMTTKGDMVDYDSARQRLGIGSANQILQVKSNLPSWETVDLADTVLTTAGDVLYENATPELARLGAGTQYNNLQMGASLPAWSASSTSTLTTTGDLLYASGANTLARLAGGTSGDVLTANGAGVAPSYQTAGGGGVWTQEGITELGVAGTSLTVDGLSLDLTPTDGDYSTIKVTIDTTGVTPRQVDGKINAQTDYGGNCMRLNSGSWTGAVFNNTTTIPLSKSVAPNCAPAGEINIFAGMGAGGEMLKYLWSIQFDLDSCWGGGDVEGTHSTIFTGIEFIGTANWSAGSTATVYALSRTP